MAYPIGSTPPAKKAKPAKKVGRAKKPVSKPKADRTNTEGGVDRHDEAREGRNSSTGAPFCLVL